jgi:hypothetical protein
MGLAVIYAKLKTNHFWSYLRAACPGLNNPCRNRLFALNLFEEFCVYVWAFVS